MWRHLLAVLAGLLYLLMLGLLVRLTLQNHRRPRR